MRALPLTFVLLLAGSILACNGGEAGPRSLRLEGIRPLDSQGLFLNEELVLTFSAPVDPASITRSSLAITSTDGTRASGRWLTQGRILRFVPDPVLRASLDDGGYLPGTQYRLTCSGFPHLDGLRGLSGEPLSRGFKWNFTTVEPGADTYLFDDATPGSAEPLLPRQADRLRGARIRPWEPIVLTCMEPIDPSTLSDEDFELIAYEPSTQRQGDWFVSSDAPLGVPLPLSVVLRSNDPQGSQGALPCCELELHPREPLRPGVYDMVPRQRLGLTDFHGNPLPRRGSFSSLRVRVAQPVGEASTRRPSLPFLDPSERSPLAVPETDGLALWKGGRVSIRYPAAAGSGAAGAIGHGHQLTVPDVHATSVAIPPGQELSLTPGTGLRVLRAQRGLRIGGSLSRRLGPDIHPRGPSEGEDPFLPGETLSEWLLRAGTEGWDWTVIIAGGDLTVVGEIDVDTPLLLVAGGWIRASGLVRHAKRQLWLMGDGGGAQDLTASTPSLVLDPPRTNPLREDLRVAVVSSPLPSAVRNYEWTDVDAAGHDGRGRWIVSFLPPSGGCDARTAVGHPRLLPSDGPLRVLVVLEISAAKEPGEPWDPPFVDYVDLRWEEPD